MGKVLSGVRMAIPVMWALFHAAWLMLLPALVLGLFLFLVSLGNGNAYLKDESDRKSLPPAVRVGERFWVYTDAATGCEYLVGSTGAMLTPRLGREGRPKGCKAAGTPESPKEVEGGMQETGESSGDREGGAR